MSFQLSANKRCLSAPDATSLHHCLQNHRQYDTQPADIKEHNEAKKHFFKTTTKNMVPPPLKWRVVKSVVAPHVALRKKPQKSNLNPRLLLLGMAYTGELILL